MAPPRLLADEMVGRLARYLRAAGCDTIYARGLSDEEIRALAREEGRVLVTRDRELARRTPGAILLESPALAEQWRAVARRLSDLPRDLAFSRCTLCNGELRGIRLPPESDRAPGVPWHRLEDGRPLYRCTACGHLYWEGSHSERLRRAIQLWSAEASA